MVQIPSSIFRRAVVLAIGAAAAVAVAAIALPHQGSEYRNDSAAETVSSQENSPDGLPPQVGQSAQVPEPDQGTDADPTGPPTSQPPGTGLLPGDRTATATHTVAVSAGPPHAAPTAPGGTRPGKSPLGASSTDGPTTTLTRPPAASTEREPTAPKTTAPAKPTGQQPSSTTAVPEQTSATRTPTATSTPRTSSSVNKPSGPPPTTSTSAAPSKPTSEAEPPPVGGSVPGVIAENVTQSALTVVNALRKKAGVDPLAQDSCADGAAVAQAKKQAEAARQEAFHSGNLTVCVSGSGGAGENVLYSSSNISVQTAINAWMGSGPHAANILDSSYRHMGVARAQGSDGHWYWAQYFYR